MPNINAKINTPKTIVAKHVSLTNISRADLDLDQVTNESKIDMFADPSFTGIVSANEINVTGKITSSDNIKIAGSDPNLILQKIPGDDTHEQTRLTLGTVNSTVAFEIQTAQSDGTFVSNDYRILKDSSGATKHEWRIGNVVDCLVLDDTGLGIGTSSPTAELDVVGDATISGTLDVTNDATVNGILNVSTINENSPGTGGITFNSPNVTYKGRFHQFVDNDNDPSDVFVVDFTQTGSSSGLGGRVGIGTTTPADKLQVVEENAGQVATFHSNKNDGTEESPDYNAYIDIVAGISGSQNKPGLGTIKQNRTPTDRSLEIQSDRAGTAYGITTGEIHLKPRNTTVLTVKYDDSTDEDLKRVGIGTTNPTKELDVIGDATISGTLNVSGTSFLEDEVIIGSDQVRTETPSGNLHIVDSANPRLHLISGNTGINTETGAIGFYKSDEDCFATITGFNTGNGTGDIHFKTDDGTTHSTKMVISGDGNVGIGTTNPAQKLHVDGPARFTEKVEIKPDRGLGLQIVSPTGVSAGLHVKGVATVGHDLFQKSGFTDGFGDNSNHFHSLIDINRINQAPEGDVKNIERVQERYYAIEDNSLPNDNAAFWAWHRVAREISINEVDTSAATLDVSALQDSNNRSANNQNLFVLNSTPSKKSEELIITLNGHGINAGDSVRMKFTQAFEGPIVAASIFGKVTSVTTNTLNVELYGGSYKTTGEVPDGNDQTALTFDEVTLQTIGTNSIVQNGNETQLQHYSKTNFTPNRSKDETIKASWSVAHGLVKNEHCTLITDGRGDLVITQSVYVLDPDPDGDGLSAILVYGRRVRQFDLAVFSPFGSSNWKLHKGSIDGIHDDTLGDNLIGFSANNVGEYKSFQIGPGSQTDADAISIGKNVYNNEAGTVKIGYDNAMLNIKSDGIIVDGTVSADGIDVGGVGSATLEAGNNLILDAGNAVVINNGPLRLNSITTTNRDQLASQNGDIIYNSTTHKFQGYANGTWVDLH